MAIQIRRGTDSEWESNKSSIVAGEPAVTLDSERMFVGTGSGTYMELANLDVLADAFDSSASYEVGDFAAYHGKVYKFTSTHSGAWNASDVEEVALADALDSLGEDVYTKAEADALLALKADASDVNSALALKADKSDTYTKTEVNTALALKADASDATAIISGLASKNNEGFIDIFASQGLEDLNLFDINADNTTNGYYDRTNTFVSSATVGMSDYIRVVSGLQYYSNLSAAGFILWYDKNKDFIGYTDFTNGTQKKEAPISANYAKFMFLIANINSFGVFCDSVKSMNISGMDKVLPIANQFRFSPNLLDKNDPDYLVDKYYRYSDGALVDPATGYDQSGFIPVKSGKKYTSNIRDFSVVWYNSAKQFVGGTNWSSFNTNGYVTCPLDASFARFGALRSNAGFPVWQVVEGDTLPSYMSFGDILPKTAYYGKSGVAFGTSLTYRAQTTGGYLQYLQGLIGADIDNQGIGNATILVTSDYPTLDILAKVKNYASYGNKDFCILEGFVNDFYRNYNKLGTWKDTAETSVCGCVRSAINHILTQNEDITLILVLDHYGQTTSSSTSVNSNGDTQYEFYEEIAKVADSMGVPVIKEYELSGMNEYTPDYFIDNIHPTALGAEQSANTIYSAMQNLPLKLK